MIWISSLCGDAQTEILEKHSWAWHNQITVISSRFADFNSLSWISISSQQKTELAECIVGYFWENISISQLVCFFTPKSFVIYQFETPFIRWSENSKNCYHCNYCTQIHDDSTLVYLCMASSKNVNVRRHTSKQDPPQNRPNNN